MHVSVLRHRLTQAAGTARGAMGGGQPSSARGMACCGSGRGQKQLLPADGGGVPPTASPSLLLGQHARPPRLSHRVHTPRQAVTQAVAVEGAALWSGRREQWCIAGGVKHGAPQASSVWDAPR